MKSIRVYEIASISEENAKILHLKTHFYWSTESFGNIEEGDGIFIVNNRAKKVFFSIVERTDIPSDDITMLAKIKDSTLTTKANNKPWGLFTKLRIVEEKSTNGELNMRLLQKKIFILYNKNKAHFTDDKKKLALYRIELLSKYFKSGIISMLLNRYCTSYIIGEREPIPQIPVEIKGEHIKIGSSSAFDQNDKDLVSLLKIFSKEADDWFAKNNWLKDRHLFFKRFFRKNNLRTASWLDFQQVGKNLHAFRNNMARMRALGHRPNHTIQRYRKAFEYIAYGRDPLEKKMLNLLDKEGQYHLQYFSTSSLTELLGYAFPDQYVFYNKRNESALDYLNINLRQMPGENFGEYYKRYNEGLMDVKELYQKIVHYRTTTTIELEIDQFFSWLYEYRIKPYEYKLSNIKKYSKNLGEQIEVVQESYEDEDIIDVFQDSVHETIKPFKDYLDDDVKKEIFIPSSYWDRIKSILLHKKNIILQGPPGVGKTFAAKRLAYNILGQINSSKVEVVQFHQSYSYEDFIQGIRPTEDGGFKINGGSFYNFCQKAIEHPDIKHFFIIEEINRGNLARIFGELMLLIEADKRGPDNAITLTYSKKNETFYVPENVYVIGTMNTADRSLSMVDYALRRRFSFMELEPSFDEKFKAHLLEKGVSEELINIISKRIGNLNKIISQDEKKLGKGFRVGHSYFCNPTTDNHAQWYQDIIELEIQPLLEEYWFDESKKVSEQVKKLLNE